MQLTRRRRLAVGCVFTYRAEVPTPAVFMVRPAIARATSTEGDRWLTDPPGPVACYTDLYGNECTRIVLPAGRSQFGFSAIPFRSSRKCSDMRSTVFAATIIIGVSAAMIAQVHGQGGCQLHSQRHLVID